MLGGVRLYRRHQQPITAYGRNAMRHTTMGRRIRPMKGLGMEYRSAVSSMDATTDQTVSVPEWKVGEQSHTIVSAEGRYERNQQQPVESQRLDHERRQCQNTTYAEPAAQVFISASSTSSSSSPSGATNRYACDLSYTHGAAYDRRSVKALLRRPIHSPGRRGRRCKRRGAG